MGSGLSLYIDSPERTVPAGAAEGKSETVSMLRYITNTYLVVLAQRAPMRPFQ